MSGIMSMLLGAVSSAAGAVDEFFNRVTLLLPGNGTNGAQNNTFLDSSSNNFTITRNGNTTQGTFSPFSQTGWGNYFNGSTDYLSIADNAALELGSGSFTVEAWVWTSSTAAQTVITKRNGIAAFNFVLYLSGGTAVQLYCSSNGSSFDMFSGASVGTITLNTWNHITIQRSGNNWYGSVNGTVTSLGTNSSTVFNNANPWLIGADAGANYVTGYISNVRIVTGSAVYGASNFTVPTTPLTAISGTQLLTCQSNRFIDNSTNAYAITVNGNPSVQAFSPFAPTAAYDAAVVGGSGYFDGTGDSVTSTSTLLAASNTSTFTIECYVYPTSFANLIYLVGDMSAGGDFLSLNITTTGKLEFYWFDGGVKTYTTTTDSVQLNAWNYIAAVVNSNAITLYVNKSTASTATGTATLTTRAGQVGFAVGFQGGNPYFTGYVSNLRVSTTARTISIPTAPFTSDANTRWLLNFTNAGITDATAKNDLETVGNAQISTTQSKFGGSSMYFDGTGDYAYAVSSAANSALGSGDWTVEFWLYTNAGSTTYNVIDWRPFATQGAYFSFYLNSGVPTYYTSSADRIVGGAAIPATTWTHVAISRSGTSTRMFINGTQSGSTYTDSANYLGSLNRPAIGGGGSDTGNTLNGYIDDLRVTKGYARYTSTFTPPTSAFALQ